MRQSNLIKRFPIEYATRSLQITPSPLPRLCERWKCTCSVIAYSNRRRDVRYNSLWFHFVAVTEAIVRYTLWRGFVNTGQFVVITAFITTLLRDM